MNRNSSEAFGKESRYRKCPSTPIQEDIGHGPG